MNIIKSWVVASSLSVVFALSHARAEDLTGRWGLTGIAQAGFPLGQEIVKDNARDVGTELGGMLRYGLSKHLGVGIGYENIDLGHGLRVEPITANLLWSFLPENRWTPVLQLGGGASSNFPDKRNLVAPTARAALGVEYFPCRYFSVGPQVTYHYVEEKGAPAPGHVHALGAGLSASLFFGGAHSESKPAPAARAVAQTPPPPPAAVPPADSDGDGVTDDKDQCPGTPSGIAVDSNGCPKKLEQNVSIELKVLFDTGKSIVKPDYRGEIERVANFLKAYPEVKAEIEGHTDDVGADAANKALSQRRADAVRDFLIKEFAVDGGRVKAVGYGEERPIADNATPEGRTKNRRVVATLETVTRQP